MFLQREYTMRINKETSVLNKNLTISTNDQGIDIIFRLIDCPYIKLSLKQNLYARIILLDPLGKQIDSDITSIVENRVIFKLTKNLMANIKCTGVYKLYIAIMDDKTNVNLLPPIKCTIEESEIEVRGLSVGLVNQSAIDNSLNTDYGNEIALFNADGSYNRTVWISGDMITTARMNKLEDAASVSRDEILNLKEQITELNEKNTLKVMIGTEYEPIIISNLNKGFYIISGYVQDFPNKNPYLLSDENYFMVTFSYGNYSKIIRCLSGEEDFVKYKYDKVLEVIYRNEQELVVCEQAEGYVRVTLDEYQYIELNEDREVILPKPDSFTEIKLYVDAKQSDKLTFDGVIWNEPLDLVLGEMNTIYLSYINDKWYGSTNSDKDASDSSTPNQEATTHTCRETLFPSNGEVQLTSAPIQDLTLYSDCTIKIPSELSGKNVTLNVINTNDLTLRFSQDAKYHTFNLKAGTMSMFNINIDSEDSRIIRLHCIEDIIGDGDTIVEKYSITRHLSNSTINNTSNLIEKNGSYNATISANSGYEIDGIVVTMGGTDISSTVVSGKRINIPNVTGDIVIMVTTTAVQITYTITNNLSHCTTNNNSNVISEGSSYRAIVTPNVGYQIERTTVTMGGTDISSTVVTGNNINIASVTGDIVITVIATASVSTPTTYTVTNNLSHCSTSNASNTIEKNESYNATISPNSGYEIDGIVVKMGGTNITSSAVSGNNINIANVTGDIVIIVTTTAVQTTYTVTNNLSNCTTNNSSTVIEKNESYNATISANSGYEIKSIVVTMGGTNVSSTVVNGNKISIPSVTGIVVITVTTNKIENGGELKDFPYADDLVEIAMTYWRNANNEYVDGQPWSQGITYRASNTPLSAYCEASMSSENSFWVSIKGRHYKAMDCSTLVGLCLRGYTYENGPYANETQFNAFRTDRNQTNPSVSWAFTVPREAANIGKYCYDNNWIVPLSTIGNSSNNYAGLKKGDIIFWAKKKSDGNYKEPDRFMKISHVAIVYGNSDTFNGRLSIVECTTVTPRNHTWQDGTTLNCGVRIKDLVNSKPDEVVLVARIQL